MTLEVLEPMNLHLELQNKRPQYRCWGQRCSSFADPRKGIVCMRDYGQCPIFCVHVISKKFDHAPYWTGHAFSSYERRRLIDLMLGPGL